MYVVVFEQTVKRTIAHWVDVPRDDAVEEADCIGHDWEMPDAEEVVSTAEPRVYTVKAFEKKYPGLPRGD